MTTECSCKLCPSPGIYAVTSMPFVKRTLAIFRKAELGFLGVVVETFVQTPRLKGAGKKTGLFFKTLNPFASATVLCLGWTLTLFFLINWLIVGIKFNLRNKIAP